MNTRLIAKLTSNPNIKVIKTYKSVMTENQFFASIRFLKKVKKTLDK